MVFDNTNLSVVDWNLVRTLGDEKQAKRTHDARKKRFTASGSANPFRVAGRAYRALAVALRMQGVSKDATRFHYRSEVMDRKTLLFEAPARLFSQRFLTAPVWSVRLFASWLIGAFAGYCNYLGRLFVNYAVVVLLVAGAMQFAATQEPQGGPVSKESARDTLVLSVTSFHSRGVQPPGLHLDDTLSTLAAADAVFGLLIEGLFIATFTRRATGGW